MLAQFLTRLLEKLCPYRFYWPHSGVHGQDYQICLICGTAFGYDWSTMRRTGPLVLPPDVNADFSPRSVRAPGEKKSFRLQG